jgi:hypothetical protein
MHSLAAFAHRLVGQTDDAESGQARRDLALHFNGPRFQPEIGNRRYQRDHVNPPASTAT